MPTNATISEPPPEPTFDRLWSISDVAHWMGKSRNTVHEYTKLPDAPGVVVEDARGRRWRPQDWWQWAADRAAADKAARQTALAHGTRRGSKLGVEVYA